jgi:hypothetical protein
MQTNIDQAAGVFVKSQQAIHTCLIPEYKREILAVF